MIIYLTIGVLKGREELKPIQVSYVGSTKHWPKDTFHLYTWYRCTIKIPFNMGRPKIKGWRIISHQEEKE